MGIEEFAFGSGDAKYLSRKKRVKLQDKENVRLGLAWFPGSEVGKPNFKANPKFVGAETHFFDGVGYVLHDGPEFSKLAGKQPAIKIATVAIKWPLKGNNPSDYEVLYWLLSKKKYDDIKAIHDEWNLSTSDLSVKCTEPKYQQLTIQPVKGNILVGLEKQQPELFKQICAEVKEFVLTIKDEIGQSYSIQELTEKLKSASGGKVLVDDSASSLQMVTPGTSSSSAELEDLISSVDDL